MIEPVLGPHLVPAAKLRTGLHHCRVDHCGQLEVFNDDSFVLRLHLSIPNESIEVELWIPGRTTRGLTIVGHYDPSQSPSSGD